MILALALTLATSTTVVIPERRYDAQLVRVIDGDTLQVTVTARAATRLPGQDIALSTSTVETVRLAGVNAPEARAKCEAEKAAARAARLFLEERLRGAPLELVTRGEEREKFGRVLADVEVAGASVTQEMIRRGLADPYSGGARDQMRWCRPSPAGGGG